MTEGLSKYLKPTGAIPYGRPLEGNSLRRYLTDEDLARRAGQTARAQDSHR